MKKSIAIIPARGGSKRIPRKNIKNFVGYPIIKYSIEAAIQSNIFDKVMVSTDDSEITAVAKKYGAEVPFLRSAENSSDYAGTAEVIEEVIQEYKKLGQDYFYLCCIYPTAPFVTIEKLKNAMNLLVDSNADCVLPIMRFSYPVQRALKIENNLVKMIWPENYHSRSQDLMPVYHDCGQFYCLKTNSLLEQKKLYPDKTIPIELPESEVQDIDNEEDWKLAEMKYRLINNI